MLFCDMHILRQIIRSLGLELFHFGINCILGVLWVNVRNKGAVHHTMYMCEVNRCIFIWCLALLPWYGKLNYFLRRLILFWTSQVFKCNFYWWRVKFSLLVLIWKGRSDEHLKSWSKWLNNWTKKNWGNM